MYYYPISTPEFLAWLKKLDTEIVSEAVKLKEPEADVAALKADIKAILNQFTMGAATAGNTSLAVLASRRIRSYIRRLKTNPLYTEETGAVLDIIDKPATDSYANFKPVIKVIIIGGTVRVKFVKKTGYNMNVYSRIGDTGDFTLLGTVARNPYEDLRPPVVPGVAELRKYYVKAMINNKEVGLPSETVSVDFTS